MSDPLADLDVAAKRYDETKAAHAAAQEVAIAAAITALRAGCGPTEVAKRSPFTAAYVRRLARDAGIPPGTPGKKPAKPAPKRR